MNIVCRTVVRNGHGGTEREGGGKIAERGAVLENDYFQKKVNNYGYVQNTWIKIMRKYNIHF